tara:strand:- start:1044 stop:1250 length:207 start_codon:yes stop_codon:yes gene_type:complete
MKTITRRYVAGKICQRRPEIKYCTIIAIIDNKSIHGTHMLFLFWIMINKDPVKKVRLIISKGSKEIDL